MANKRLASILTQTLKQSDPQIHDILLLEQKRQLQSICLIPSENFTSKAVLDSLQTVFQNKYSEGYPGNRYYGGNANIDSVEVLCQQRALAAFDLDPERWGVNVQALSGAPANLYVYSAIMNVGDRMMGLDLPSGGHLSHGYQTATKKISAISKYFETLPFKVDPKSGLVDYASLSSLSKLYRPKVIVAGGSAYPRNWDYKRMRQICDDVDCYLMADMAHISGLVSAGVLESPFEYADIVTTTTHKSLRGPRGAMIFYRKGIRSVTKKGTEIPYNLEVPINFSVFPGHQGGPHNHTIAALAVALKQTQDPSYKVYQRQVLLNAKEMESRFRARGYNMVTGGTDTHLLLLDLHSKKIDGARLERVLELCNIATNKNTISTDTSALVPMGIRLGTPAMTTRGFVEADFGQVVDLIDEALEIGVEICAQTETKRFKDFNLLLGEGKSLFAVRDKVIEFAEQFPLVI